MQLLSWASEGHTGLGRIEPERAGGMDGTTAPGGRCSAPPLFWKHLLFKPKGEITRMDPSSVFVNMIYRFQRTELSVHCY